MNITYSKHYAKFSIPTVLTAKPIEVSLRKRKSQVEAARARLEKEVDRLERQFDTEGKSARALREEFTRRLRSSFKHIFKGDILVKKTTVLTWKYANRLVDHRENDYRVVGEERIVSEEWR